MKKRKYILDTDIGDDIDDALALALALEMPEVDLIGVTTVFRNTDQRARIARKMLKLWNRDIPVYAGLRQGPVKKQCIDDVCCQYTEKLNAPEYRAVNDMYADGGQGAVDFLAESARKYGSELTLVAIGPLTNVAAALQKDPEAMKQVRIVLMGGDFHRQFSEWNIVCDPDSAKAVLEGGCNVTCVGLEVTEKTRFNDRQQAFIMAAEQDEAHKYLSSLVRRHYDFTGVNCVLHDPLAMYYAVHPEILTTEMLVIQVETKGEITAGMTVNMDEMFFYKNEPQPGRRIAVAKTVDCDNFMEAFFRTVYPGSVFAPGMERKVSE